MPSDLFRGMAFNGFGEIGKTGEIAVQRQIIGQVYICSPIRIYQEAADLPLHQRQHDRLFDGNRRQIVAFLFDVPLRCFLPQQLGEIVRIDAD